MPNLRRPDEPPELPGLPGKLTQAAHKLRTATQILPPAGVGVGIGIGLGCAVGWPLRQAYGPPRAVCGPAIGVGIGVGYGQGFGRRFGRDTRPHAFTQWIASVETRLDSMLSALLTPFRRKRDRAAR